MINAFFLATWPKRHLAVTFYKDVAFIPGKGARYARGQSGVCILHGELNREGRGKTGSGCFA
ncbi:hypothetical protein GCM10007385_15730 [Tateyamaria omphalii]|nr:hypothetical protein GCM10007385_15730 [Tateyamaria omphalii]